MIAIKAWNNLFYLLFACTLLLTTVFTMQPTYTPKVQAYLKTLAATDPEERVTVIVQKHDHRDAAERAVTAQGGEVVSALPLINAFVAKIVARSVNQLEQSAAIKWVSLDAPVVSQNSGLEGALHL